MNFTKKLPRRHHRSSWCWGSRNYCYGSYQSFLWRRGFFNTTDGSFAGHQVTEDPLFGDPSPVTAHGLEIFSAPTDGGNNETFGKANGLGDIEFAAAPASIQIGNRIWYDANNDGLQTAGETGIIPNGVTVQLYNSSGTLVTNTTTTNGEYYFF